MPPPDRALLFDWGNTLMEDIPGFTGPMAGWPRVAVIPGVPEVLAGLKPREEIAVTGSFALKSAMLVSRLGAGCADD